MIADILISQQVFYKLTGTTRFRQDLVYRKGNKAMLALLRHSWEAELIMVGSLCDGLRPGCLCSWWLRQIWFLHIRTRVRTCKYLMGCVAAANPSQAHRREFFQALSPRHVPLW